jgi:hypothetical protein
MVRALSLHESMLLSAFKLSEMIRSQPDPHPPSVRHDIDAEILAALRRRDAQWEADHPGPPAA